VAYELLILVANAGQSQAIRVGADVWIKQTLAAMGAGGHLMLGVTVAVLGLLIVLTERKRAVKLRPSWFGLLILESTVYAIVVAVGIMLVLSLIFTQTARVDIPVRLFDSWNEWFLHLALSIGAGLYEELVFRVILVGLLFAGMRAVLEKPSTAYIVSALVGAAIFSAVHHIGPLGDAWNLGVFFFRFLFGLALNALYLWRGFGVAAWTHAIYDILVVTFFTQGT